MNDPNGDGIDDTNSDLLAQFLHGQRVEREQLLNRLSRLLEEVDAEFAFILLFARTRGWTGNDLDEMVTFMETAASCLYPHFGKGDSRSVTMIEELGDLIRSLGRVNETLSPFDDADILEEPSKALNAARIYTEFVRGDAYPSQIHQRIVEVQGPFESWFKSTVGIGPLKAVAILEGCEKAMWDNYERSIPDTISSPFSFADFAEALPASFEQVQVFVPNLTQSEWESLSDLIGFTPSNAASITTATDHRRRQLYYLRDGRCLIPAWSTVYDSLFDAFDAVTRGDQPFRDKSYVPKLSEWTETKAVEHFRRVFPSTVVFSSLYYDDPDNPGGQAELDAAVLWGPFLLIVEVKAKQFRDDARLGDRAKLVSDLKGSIADAYKQCLRAIRYIESVQTAEFREARTGRILSLEASKLRVIYPISVTLRQFGMLQADLSQMKTLGLFGNSRYPWSVTLDDLDVVTRFIGKPDYLVHYIKRRIELQHSTTDVSSDELDLFGSYLDTRLPPSRYWNRTTEHGESYHHVVIDGASERFEQFYDDSEEPEPPLELTIPLYWRHIIDLLHKREDNDARLCISALLDLSNEELERAGSQVEEEIAKFRAGGFTSGMPRSVTYSRKDVTLVFVFWSDRSHLILEMKAVIEREMYRSKSVRGIAIGIAIGALGAEPPIINYLENTWVEDERLEAITRKTLSKLLAQAPAQKRNDLCFCNSGKKFKQCHMNALK